MNIKEFLIELNSIKLNRAELETHIKDSEYIEYLIERYTFNIKVRDYNDLLDLIKSSNITDYDFGDISLNKLLDQFNIEGQPFLCIGLFQEDYICLNSEKTVLVLFDPSNQNIILKNDFDDSTFLNFLFKITQFDIDYVLGNHTENKDNLLDSSKYPDFMEIVLNQYE